MSASNAPTHIDSSDQPRVRLTAETLTQQSGQPYNQIQNFGGFLVQPSQKIQPQTRSHLTAVQAPVYSDFSSQQYKSGTRDHAQKYRGFRDAKLDPPQESIESSGFQTQDAPSELEGALASTEVGQGYQPIDNSMARPEYGDRRARSLDDSGTTSPISPQDFAALGFNRACSTRTEDDPMGLEDRHDFDRPPPWSELKTKAGKERKRLPLACIACRRKKIKCSGEKPTCKHCQHSRTPCVYRITTRKPTPRTDYMSMLDKRLKRMEERVIKIIPKEEVDRAVAIGRANVRPSWSGQGEKGPNGKKRVAIDAFGHDLDEWVHSKTKHYALRGIDLDEKDKFMEGSESLPSKEIQEHLSELFFEYLYGQSYHLLHKPSFMRRLR